MNTPQFFYCLNYIFITEFDNPEHIGSDDGYHRDCYQRFTMNLNRIQLVDKKEKRSLIQIVH